MAKKAVSDFMRMHPSQHQEPVVAISMGCYGGIRTLLWVYVPSYTSWWIRIHRWLHHRISFVVRVFFVSLIVHWISTNRFPLWETNGLREIPSPPYETKHILSLWNHSKQTWSTMHQEGYSSIYVLFPMTIRWSTTKWMNIVSLLLVQMSPNWMITTNSQKLFPCSKMNLK